MITRRQLFAGILGLTTGPSWCGPQEILAAADVIVVGAGLAGLERSGFLRVKPAPDGCLFSKKM